MGAKNKFFNKILNLAETRNIDKDTLLKIAIEHIRGSDDEALFMDKLIQFDEGCKDCKCSYCSCE